MSIPHNCVGDPCFICNPHPRIVAATVVDAEMVHGSAKDKQIADLMASARGHWRKMATATTCGETWEDYAGKMEAVVARLVEDNARLHAEVRALRRERRALRKALKPQKEAK